jgi:hypothetical protein
MELSQDDPTYPATLCLVHERLQVQKNHVRPPSIVPIGVLATLPIFKGTYARGNLGRHKRLKHGEAVEQED